MKNDSNLISFAIGYIFRNGTEMFHDEEKFKELKNTILKKRENIKGTPIFETDYLMKILDVARDISYLSYNKLSYLIYMNYKKMIKERNDIL